MTLEYITKTSLRGLYLPDTYRSAIGFSQALPKNILELQLTEEPTLSVISYQMNASATDNLSFEAIHNTFDLLSSFTASYCALVKTSGALDLEIIAISAFDKIIAPNSSLKTIHKINLKINV